MKKLIILSLFITTICNSQILVSEKPSEPKNKIVQKLTKRAQIWIPGQWIEKNNKYIWKKGYWANKRPGYIFIQGYWEKEKRGWIWKAGEWKKININTWNTVYSS